ncbi:MAG: MBL fold metallo-hydrolase [Patescibacteria group bacterium]
MVITFYGENCFKIQSGDTTILIDPFSDQIGLTSPRLKPDILVKTLTSFPVVLSPAYSARQIIGPGEYNLKDIDIVGFELLKESTEKFIKTIYLMKIENIKVGFLGHLAGILEPEILERFEEIDILFIPAGGSPFIEQKSAVKLIKQLEPKIVIPCLFKIPGLKRRADDVKEFIEEFNHQKPVPQEKLTIKKKDLEGIKKTEIVVLKI